MLSVLLLLSLYQRKHSYFYMAFMFMKYKYKSGNYSPLSLRKALVQKKKKINYKNIIIILTVLKVP